jgi:hypothetical protein
MLLVGGYFVLGSLALRLGVIPAIWLRPDLRYRLLRDHGRRAHRPPHPRRGKVLGPCEIAENRDQIPAFIHSLRETIVSRLAERRSQTSPHLASG